MYELWDDFAKPIFEAALCVSLVIGTIVGIGVGIDSKVQSNECKIWGGEYHFSTGCLMKYNDKIIPLDKYKTIQTVEITQPIEQNINISAKGK